MNGEDGPKPRAKSRQFRCGLRGTEAASPLLCRNKFTAVPQRSSFVASAQESRTDLTARASPSARHCRKLGGDFAADAASLGLCASAVHFNDANEFGRTGSCNN